MTKDELAKWLHDNYEQIAKAENWQTQEITKVDFENLPAENKSTMLALADRMLNTFNFISSKPMLAVRCPLVEIDTEMLQMCIDMYKSGEKLTAIKWLIEEAKQDKYTFGIKWAKEYFEGIGLDKVEGQ